MNISARSNVNPQQTIQDAARTSAIGQAPPAGTAAPQISLGEPDQVSQSAGASGRAQVAALVETSAYSERLRSLLKAGDFDGIAQMVRQTSTRELGRLDLTLSEIQAIAQGMGQGDWNANAPVFASFSDEERQAVQTLLIASTLSANNRLSGLKNLLGDAAVFSYLRSASLQELSGLSATQRSVALNSLDPGNSVMGSISGAANEAILRRGMGDSQQLEDTLASKLLRSARNESELRDLLGQLNQFNRDDVVFRYVMDLSSRDLAGLSDGMKRELLSKLVDTGVQLPFMNVDLNSVANLDETVSMTFKEHAQAAQRLYVAMKPEAQRSQAVQELVQKSDALVAQLQEVQANLQRDIRSGALTSAKISEYRQTLESLKTQTAGKPELQQQVTAMMATLSQVQAQLGQASEIRQQTHASLQQSQQQLKTTEASLATLKSEIQTAQSQLDQASTQLQAQETQLLAAYQQGYELRRQAGDLGQSYTQLLDQMQSLLAAGQPARAQLPKLEQVATQLRQLETQLRTGQNGLAPLAQQLEQVESTLSAQRSRYNTAASDFNAQRGKLVESQEKLSTQLKRYGDQIQRLEQTHGQAQTQLANLPADSLSASQRTQLQGEIDATRHEIDAHQASLQTLQGLQTEMEPAVTRLQSAPAELAPQQAAVEAGLERVETEVATNKSLLDQGIELYHSAVSAVQELAGRVTNHLSSLRQRFSQLKPEELAQEKNTLQSLRADLLREAAASSSPADVQQEIKALDEMLGQLNAVERQIGEAQSAQGSLTGALNTMAERQTNLNRELAAATQTAQQASDSLNQAQSGVRALEGDLQRLGTQMTAYQQEIAAWTERLNAVDSQNQSAKDALLQSMRASQQVSQVDEEAALNGVFATGQQQRAQIEAELARLRQQVGNIQGQMQAQRQELGNYQHTLTQASKTLQTAQTTVLKLQQQLREVTQQNKTTLAETAAVLQRSGQAPTSNSLQHTANALRKSYDALKDLVQSSEQLIAQSTQQSDSFLRQEQQVRQVQGELEEGIRDIQRFENGPLTQIHTRLDGQEASFAQLKQQDQALLQRARTLAEGVASGRIQMSQADLQREREALIAGLSGTTAASGELRRVMQQIDGLLGQAESVIGSTRDQISNVEADIATWAPQVAGLLSDAQRIREDLAVMESEVNDVQQQLLQNQRTLLERRRGLGIDSEVYKVALERSLELLNSGQPLSPQDVEEMRQLEQRLSRIEAANADMAGPLAEQITALNIFKSRVNNRLEELNRKGGELEALRGRLQGALDKVTEHLGPLENLLPQMLEARNQLQAHLDSLRRNPIGSPDYRQKLAAAETQLAALDARIAEMNGLKSQTQGIAGRLTEILSDVDKGLALLNQLKGRLELLQGQLQDMTEQAQQMLLEYEALEKTRERLSESIQAHQGQLLPPDAEIPTEQPTVPAAAPLSRASGTATTSAELQQQRHTENRRQSFSENLTNRLTSFWSHQRRQSEERRGAESEARREDFLSEMEQRLVQARQDSEALSTHAVKDTQLAAITDHLLSLQQTG
ncbi:MAG: hypothetical protein ACO1RX_06470 [Candidatus Sericytochromatia bacterium]